MSLKETSEHTLYLLHTKRYIPKTSVVWDKGRVCYTIETSNVSNLPQTPKSLGLGTHSSWVDLSGPLPKQDPKGVDRGNNMSIQNLQNKAQELRDLISKARALENKHDGTQKGLDYAKTSEGLLFKLMELESEIAAYKAKLKAAQAPDPLA